MSSQRLLTTADVDGTAESMKDKDVGVITDKMPTLLKSSCPKPWGRVLPLPMKRWSP